LLLIHAARAAGTNTVTLSPVPGAGVSVLRVMGALGVVFALFFAGVWLLRNWRRLHPGRSGPPKLRVLEVRSLGQRHSLCVIAYEQQRLLVGVSPTGVNLLTQLPEGETLPDSPPVALPTFAATLQQVLSGRR
jgi:flagellar biosynthetic protein FliO